MINLDALLSNKEKSTLEVKLASGGLPNSVWESYSSLANTFGGVILLGVEEDKKTHDLILRGESDAHKMISDIWNTLNNPQKISTNILLDHHVFPLIHQEKEIVVIEVPRADRKDKPVYVGENMFKGTFRRNHEGDYCCTKEEIKSMLRDQAEETQDALLLEHLSLSDLNQESIHRYRILFNNLKPSHTWCKLQDEEFLVKIGAARKSRKDSVIHPTLGGLIFFGDFMTISDELPNYFLDYRERFSHDARWSDRVCCSDGTWSGNVFDFYFKVMDRLTADVKTPFVLNEQMQRVDDTEVHRSLRECLANALIHADYYGRRGIVIDKEFRKITISNPGTFRIGIDEAIAGGISDARNGKLFNMFSLIKVGERSGSGLCDVYSVWKTHGYKKPLLKETVGPDRITLVLELDGRYDGVNDGDGPKSFSIYPELTRTQRKVYEEIKRNPSAPAKWIAETVGLSKPTVERAVAVLKEKGYLLRLGSSKTGTWMIKK